MSNEFGFKDLYEVTLKATYPIEVNGKKIEIGESVAVFDKVRVSTFQEEQSVVTARGGFDNRARVWWTSTKDVRMILSQGVFSKEQFALMTGAQLVKEDNKDILLIERETLETDASGRIELKFAPAGLVFVYNKKTGEKVTNFSILNKVLNLSNLPYTEVIVDYEYNYTKPYSTLTVGRQLTNGYLSLQGKTRVKDDTTGHIVTGIIKIPKLKLMSDLSIRLGEDGSPLVG